MKNVEIIVNINNNPTKINITPNNIHINDSWMIEKISDMKNIINVIKSNNECILYPVLERSNFGMITEWRAHNLLYKLHIAQDRTGSVDLDMSEKWYRKLGYFILSILYF